jgi:molybdopterin-guanine dinucleotide biosynthesis protein A
MASRSGLILAGGRSSRMGVDKASLVLGGTTMLQRSADRLSPSVDELVVVGAPGRVLPDVSTRLPLRIVEDPVEGEGPLVGIAAGLAACTGDVAVVVAVDMPFVETSLVAALLERLAPPHRWVLPFADGRPQPLCSAFAASALAEIREHLESGDRAPMAVAADLDAYRMQPDEWAMADPTGRSFVNVNTPEEFAALLDPDAAPSVSPR